jgi:2-methylcitrate dehydratase PrpD
MDVTFKRYPLSMIAQSPAYMALDLKRETGLDPASIESVLVELNQFESEYPGKGRVGSEESSNERYTLLGVATALAHGRITRDLLRKRDDTVVSLMGRGSYVGRDDVKPLCARLTVRAGGQEYHREVTDGARHHFLSYQEVAELVGSLAPETRGAEAAVAELAEIIPTLERLDSVDRLMELAATRAA